MNLICKLFGHVKWGPRRGDGQCICGRCKKVLVPGRYDHLSQKEQTRIFLEREANLKVSK